MNYSKKILQPLIDKYEITPECDLNFQDIIKMFDNKPTYQVWAIKMLYENGYDMTFLSYINDWVNKNKSFIKKLKRKNIVLYTTNKDIEMLTEEINAIDSVNKMKKVISEFNTTQRKLLSEEFAETLENPLLINEDNTLREYCKIFIKFNELSEERKANFFKKSSRLRNTEKIMDRIHKAVYEKYDWNKSDFLRYATNNTETCKVIHNKGPYLLITLSNFEDTAKLFGGGRTEWCIAMSEESYEDYVKQNSTQYFIFDFSRKETNAFSHIGFTIADGEGIIFAQSGDNMSMIYDYNTGKETMNIYSVLEKIGIKLSSLIKIKRSRYYKWNCESLKEYVKKNEKVCQIKYDKQNVIILEVLSKNVLNELIKHTIIDKDFLEVNETTKVYVMFDFNLKYNDDNSIVVITCLPDDNGTYVVHKSQNIFAKHLKFYNDDPFKKYGIVEDDFIKEEPVDPTVLLHKFIEKNDEDSALRIIEKEGNSFNVNYVFNGKTPLFRAINKKMPNLFSSIINHPNFKDNGEYNSFCEPILTHCLYLYGSDNILLTDEEESFLKEVICTLIDSERINLNNKDINGDTALDFACRYPKLYWVAEKINSKIK